MLFTISGRFFAQAITSERSDLIVRRSAWKGFMVEGSISMVVREATRASKIDQRSSRGIRRNGGRGGGGGEGWNDVAIASKI